MSGYRVSSKHPRVVKLSGGRSSGMMLMRLLNKGQLKASRGDVIVFNNTSAEHPKTYDFVKRLKSLVENLHGIPFFWIEFCTYEDMGLSGLYQRHQSYRLVNDSPYSESNPDGYHFNGEVFEEMISHTGFLPSTLARSCTKAMKIFTTNAFLADWWGGEECLPHLGHYHNKSMVTDEDMIKLHQRNSGSTPREILLRKKEHVRNSPLSRKEQYWKNFTNGEVRVDFPKLRQHVIGGQAQLYGDFALEYYSYLGLRFEEYNRYKRVHDRISNAETNNSNSYSSQPVGEKVLVPLIQDKITKKKVLQFWKKQEFDLETTDDGLLSNCVFCPLKGKRKLELIATYTRNENNFDSPASIKWWVNIEDKYQRNLLEEERNVTRKGTKFVGFFGPSPEPVFASIANSLDKIETGDSIPAQNDMLDLDLSCHCTD